jgi:N-acetylmuramoyl-L-alanine amidase
MSTGKDLYDLLCTKVGSKYILGALVAKNNPLANVFDCAEFASWGVYQLSNKLYGCVNNSGKPDTADAYTGFWKRDADTLGIKISVEEAARTKGAFILRFSGPGLVGHIVCSDGNGGTIEAHSHADGVIKSHVSGRRWDIGIKIPWLSYDLGLPIEVKETTENIYRWKSPLMISDKVGEIQKALVKNGYHLEVDNKYGSSTFQAVKQFQYAHGLLSDGEVGSKTLAALGI